MLVVIIQIVIALLHAFRVGTLLDGTAYNLYYSYFSDFIIPFGFYFLLCANEFSTPILRHWAVKALLIFAGTTIAEIGQYFNVYAFGTTFDPADILMYGLGVMTAVWPQMAQ